jgi:hypothetical protein
MIRAALLAAPSQPAAPAVEPTPVPDDIQRDIERSDWTPEEALRWYAAGKHFDTVHGRTRIIDTGTVASNALKRTNADYHAMKGADASFPAPATAAHAGAMLTDEQARCIRLAATNSYLGDNERATLRTLLSAAATPVSAPVADSGAWAELLAAAREVIANGHQHDVGGGDVFLGTCDSAERLERAINLAAAKPVSVDEQQAGESNHE